MNRKKEEIEDEIMQLKVIFDYHARLQVIKRNKELEKHIDAILDRVSELEKQLSELNE